MLCIQFLPVSSSTGGLAARQSRSNRQRSSWHTMRDAGRVVANIGMKRPNGGNKNTDTNTVGHRAMRILRAVLTIAMLVTLSGALSACVIDPGWGHHHHYD